MQVLRTQCIISAVICGIIAKPYEYSYYIASPGHYQTLEVRDGVVVNPLSRSRPSGSSFNPNVRQGRVGTGFADKPFIRRQYPLGQTGPDFRRGGIDPNYRDIPNGELDPLFNQGGRYPERTYPQGPYDTRFNQIDLYRPNQYRPQFQDSTYDFQRRYYRNPEYGRITEQFMPSHNGISRRASKLQEIDETTTEADREEVTTQDPTCSFCEVDRVNTMDGLDETNTNPDSEPVDPENIGGSSDSNVLVQNNVVTPASVIVPGYTPLVPYYIVV